jgi:hypothetical protein
MVFMVVRFDLFIPQRFHFVRRLTTETHHTEIIANEFDGMMVVVKRRELVEEVAFIGVFDVRFKRQHPLGARHFEYLILHTEQFDVVFFFVRGAFGGLTETLAELADNALRVADNDGADRCADDDYDFEGLSENS